MGTDLLEDAKGDTSLLFSLPCTYKHMQYGGWHRRQDLPHLQLLPNHPLALSSTLPFPLAPVAEVIF